MSSTSEYPYGFHTADYGPPNAPTGEHCANNLPRQPTVRIYCEANTDFSLTVRDGNAVLAPADSNDHYQHWIKVIVSTCNKWRLGDDSYCVFALVKRVTGEAPCAMIAENTPVSNYKLQQDGQMDSKFNLSEMQSTGFRAIRFTDRPWLTLTAAAASNNFIDGTGVVFEEWSNTRAQRWMIVPYNSNFPY